MPEQNSQAVFHAIDPSLYLVINPEQCLHHDPVELAIKAAYGGVTAVQIRSKSMTDEDYQQLINTASCALSPSHVPVFVNDRVHIATASHAAGIHLGQDDQSVLSARQHLQPHQHIGLTVRSMEEADNAPIEALSYISVGGVFATKSKQNPDPPIGSNELTRIVKPLKSRWANLPIIAISGIQFENLYDVLTSGVNGIAVVSAICESKNPERAALQLRTAVSDFHKAYA